MLDVHCRELQITELMEAAANVAAMPPGTPGAQTVLQQPVRRAADEIKRLLQQNIEVYCEQMDYSSEEDLLIYAERASDFLILELAEHFRRYNVRNLPAFDGVKYVTTVRSAALVTKRTSGHVTASFAEAMCPWVLKRLNISDGTFLRLRSLSPGPFGEMVPDMVIPAGGQEVPCEIKHYADGHVRWDGIQTAISQLAAALLVMPATEGYLFAAISHPAAGQSRYRIEVIRLVT